ncbi:hypothetical protein B0H13DRAFT_1852372 [Mycena leptocephala]|nr:hypothetical protein B0H13DRAFT_1852372 [Mycena leptocephala]
MTELGGRPSYLRTPKDIVRNLGDRMSVAACREPFVNKHTQDIPGCEDQLSDWLKNQSRQQSLSNTSDNSSSGDYSDSSGLDLTELDCLAYLEVDSDHSDNDNEADWDEVAQEEFQDRLFQLIAQIEDRRDAGDADWVPSRTAYEAERAAKRHSWPTEYMT